VTTSFSRWLEYFDVSQFMPHGHCYQWRPDLVAMHAISDAVITVSYFSIPIALTYVVYRSNNRLPFHKVFLLFSIFILACGTTHLLEIVNIWRSEYYLSGVAKVVTAIASIATALSLIPILPKVVIRFEDDRVL